MNQTPIKKAVYKEQLATLRVIDEIIKIEENKEYLKRASSLFGYLTGELRYSEGAAMRRIHAARVVAKYPEVADLLKRREVSLCTISMIAKDLLETGNISLLNKIKGRSKREVEAVVAFNRGGSALPMKEQVRVIAAPVAVGANNTLISTATTKDSEKSKTQKDQHPTQSPPQPTPRPARAPAPAPTPLYRITFTATAEVHQLMEEVKAGMSHKLKGKEDIVAQVFEAGVKMLHKELTKKRTKTMDVAPPKGEGRYIPAELRRAVFERDHSECQYRYEDGSKCCSKWQLEVDHIKPLGLGGESKLANLRVTCRSHNQLLAKEAGLIQIKNNNQQPSR